MKFDFDLPLNIVFGRGRFNEIGIHTEKYGKKALIVTGRNSTRNTGVLDRCVTLLRSAGVASVVFDKVEQNPLTTTVYEGAREFLDNHCEVVIGLGGGSAMDAAKGIAFAAGNSGDLEDYIFGRKQGIKEIPIIVATTTAGTGSEGNCFSVMTNPVTKDKKSLKTKLIFPKVSIVDPELMQSLPQQSIASTGFDALSHNLEVFIARRAQPISSILALEGIKMLAEYLPRVYKDPGDIEAWEQVALANTFGGMNICLSGVGAPHALEHPVSGLYDVVHGKGLAAILPKVFEKTYGYADGKYLEIARALGGQNASDCVERIHKLLEDLKLNVTLGDLGVKAEDIDWLSNNAIKIMQANLENNPKIFTLDEIKEIYFEVL